ncbi:MAG: HemK family protein methyltransferase [Patescibacteria group bacterium]|nr:HemK family protein methyltransferase [Patescibacteria group bacterium]
MPKENAAKKRLSEWLIRDKYQGDRTVDLSADLARIEKGEPADYVIGWSDFCGCRIGLSARPLIPRSETEFWVEQVIRKISNTCSYKQVLLKQDLTRRVLDLFAGSGCVGVAVLKHCPLASVDFAEKSAKLLPAIEENLKVNGIAPDRYNLFRTNIFRQLGSQVPELGKYDFILANPPYIPDERKEKLDRRVTAWEPAMALFAKDKGLFLIKRFLSEAKGHLNPGGRVWLEFNSGQQLPLKKILEQYGYQNIEFHKDQYSRWRFVTFQMAA